MYLDDVKARSNQLNIALPAELIPCSTDEVQLLEQHLGMRFPLAYQEFLLWMGKGAGSFLRGSDCWFDDLLNLRQYAVELLEENQFTERLPETAFVFFVHGGYQFNFLMPNEGEDPPVHFFGEWTHQASFTIIYPSFSSFLATEIEDHAKLMANSQA